MAENPYVNKVVFGNNTLLDLTEDSVTANNLLEGETAHSASGAPVTGTAKQGHTIWNAIKTALTQRTKLWFADAKVTDDSTEQATKVEVVQLIDDEDELDDAPDGVYQGDYDDAPEDVLDASMVAYKDGSVEDALDDLNDTVDKRKVSILNFSATTNGVGAFTVGDATTRVCVAIIFPLGNEYTYYQYDKTNFILFNMSGVKQSNVSISGRAVFLSLE